jgi:phosphomannomutase / phosphoglucomutase
LKSTGLFATDPLLRKNGVVADYWKTGHSYMKRRTHETGALAGFEKSGHFIFNTPFGCGYDDGRLRDRDLRLMRCAPPKTWQSPTMSPVAPMR